MTLACNHLLSFLSRLALILLALAAWPAYTADSATISPHASLLSHWRRLFPTTPEIPEFLLSRSSPLTAAQLATFSSYVDHHVNNSALLSAFCSAADVLCSDNMPPGDFPDGNVFILFKKVHGKPAPLEPGVFFPEVNITIGKKIHVPDIRNKLPKTSFLPKSLADKLPLSSTYLQSLIELLVVSRMQRAMSTTVSICESQRSDRERKTCVQSIEDMADFVAETVGPKVEMLATQSADGWGQEVIVGNVIGRNGGKETPAVACHRLMFPSLVYYCHSIPTAKVYEVDLLIGNGREQKKNRAVAVCHMGTSIIEVCHFIFQGEFAWVATE